MNRTLTVGRVFSVIIVSVLLSMLISVAIAAAGSVYAEGADQKFYTSLSLLIGQGFMIIPIVLFLSARKESLTHRFRLRKISGRTTGSALLISAGIIVLVDELDRIVNMLLPAPELFANMESLLNLDSSGFAIISIFTIAIVAPVFEEMIFRGFLQKFLEEKWQDPTRAILVTSLFFTLVHMNPFWAIQIYLLGIVLGFLAWKTGSIIPGIILHALNNGLALFFFKAKDSIDPVYLWGGHVSPLFLIPAIMILVLGFKQLIKTSASVS
jgi:hypothetical protein